MWNNRVTTVSCAGVIRNGLESVTIWSQSKLLRNNLVRSQQQRLWDGQPEGLGGFEIDHQLELRRLLHGQVAELRALEDLVHVRGRAAAVAGALSGRIVLPSCGGAIWWKAGSASAATRMGGSCGASTISTKRTRSLRDLVRLATS